MARIALVSQDRARQIEAIILRLVQSGQIRGQVTEQQLIDLLEKVSSSLKCRYWRSHIPLWLGR